jgi:hypothetical protein
MNGGPGRPTVGRPIAPAAWASWRRSSPPTVLPLLETGAHRRPRDGACLMEYVSVLAGARFSDEPACTHPALAELARLVNDHMTDAAARQRLAAGAPVLIGITSADPRITALVVACCLEAADILVTLDPGGSSRDRLRILSRLARVRARLKGLGRTEGRARVLARWAELCGVPVPPAARVRSAFRALWRHRGHLTQSERDVVLADLLADAAERCAR